MKLKQYAEETFHAQLLRKTMTDKARCAYDLLKTAMLNRNSRVTLPGSYTNAELREIRRAVIDDYPELFYTDRVSRITGLPQIELLLYYALDEEQTERQFELIQAQAEKLQKKTEHMSQTEQVRTVHDILCGMISYSVDSPVTHDIYGALVEHKACCQGIARSAVFLFNRLQLESAVITGTSSKKNGLEKNHAWNMIRFRGSDIFFYIDFTGDLKNAQGNILHSYYLLDEETIYKKYSFQPIRIRRRRGYTPEFSDFNVLAIYVCRRFVKGRSLLVKVPYSSGRVNTVSEIRTAVFAQMDHKTEYSSVEVSDCGNGKYSIVIL